jgi:ABC-type uncharacterized transport system ATPase subunit
MNRAARRCLNMAADNECRTDARIISGKHKPKIIANNEDTNQQNESAFIAEARTLYYMLNAEERAAFLAQLAEAKRAVRRRPLENAHSTHDAVTARERGRILAPIRTQRTTEA